MAGFIKFCNNFLKNPKVLGKSAVIHGTGTKKGLTKMGMAASQARLLTLTARIHDVEYMAQSIQNAKLSLATQQDRVYQEYLDALDQKTFTVKDINGEVKTANFNTLCGIDAVKASRLERYTLRDDRNRIIVEDEIARGYAKFGKKGDAYGFAMFMMNGMDPNYDNAVDKEGNSYSRFSEAERQVFESRKADTKLSNEITDILDIINKSVEAICDICDQTEGGKSISETLSQFIKQDDFYGLLATLKTTFESSKIDNEESDRDDDLYGVMRDNGKAIEEQLKTISECYEKYKYQMYTAYGEEIYEAAGYRADDYDDEDFWYYVNMYKQIEANGGSIVSISEFNGLEGIGNAATDSDWLKSMVESGRITIDIATMDRKTGKMSFASTSVASDTYLEYTTTSTIDKSYLAKAEAKYEHEMKKINQKDKKFDLDLSKLETQRTALTKEYDSVKKVVEENIERTFGIFS